MVERQLEDVRENDGTPSFISDHIIDQTLPDMPDGLLIKGWKGSGFQVCLSKACFSRRHEGHEGHEAVG